MGGRRNTQGGMIDIKKVWEVCCQDCGVIDALRTKAQAVDVMRAHFGAAHKGKGQ